MIKQHRGPLSNTMANMTRLMIILLTGALLLGSNAGTNAQFTASSAVEIAGDHAKCCGSSNGDGLDGGYPLEDGDRFGRSAAAIGDLDGDGVPDVAVCASRDGDGAKKAGAVYILFMNKGGTVKSAQKISNMYGNLKTAPGWPAATSLDTQDRFGYALALVGDLDGDGVQEIAACADGDDDGYPTSDSGKAGACYILFLHRTGKVRKVQKISNSHGGLSNSAIGNLDTKGGFGTSAGGAGDLDNDGVPDLLVGAPGTDDQRGAAYILYLNRDGTVKATSKRIDMGTGTLSPKDYFGGRAIDVLGDMDQDGISDFIVSAYGADGKGAAWILFMDSTGTVTKKQKISSDGTGGFDKTAVTAETAQFGHSIAVLGDIDGDSVPDVAMSANQEGQGVLFLLTLTTNGVVKTSSRVDVSSGGFPALSAELKSVGDAGGADRFCRSLSAPGDLNADGGFSLLCGAGAHTSGDLWLMTFKPNDCHTKKPATCVSFPGGIYDISSQVDAYSFVAESGQKFCNKGTTLFSNWDHKSQTVTGALTLDACKAKCKELECESMTVKSTDGRCIAKKECTLADSTEGSMTFTAKAVASTLPNSGGGNDNDSVDCAAARATNAAINAFVADPQNNVTAITTDESGGGKGGKKGGKSGGGKGSKKGGAGKAVAATTGNATTGNTTTGNAASGNAATGNATTGNAASGNATTGNATGPARARRAGHAAQCAVDAAAYQAAACAPVAAAAGNRARRDAHLAPMLAKLDKCADLVADTATTVADTATASGTTKAGDAPVETTAAGASSLAAGFAAAATVVVAQLC